jgi:hypothetical protein
LSLLPESVTKTYDRFSAPAALIISTLLVIGPRIKLELDYAKQVKATRVPAPPPRPENSQNGSIPSDLFMTGGVRVG